MSLWKDVETPRLPDWPRCVRKEKHTQDSRQFGRRKDVVLETPRLADWPGCLRNEADAGLKAVRESGSTVGRTTRFSLR